jgi:hypothetical protein
MKTNRNYWMKRRRYGWGWTPITWQGWLFTILQTVILLTAASQIPRKPAEPSTAQLVKLIVTLLCVGISLVLVGIRTGPKPHWRWGKHDSDKSNEGF